MNKSLTGLFALAMVAACGSSSEDVSATGFITPETTIPATATAEDGDVPRDSAGRPFTYALLGETLPALSGTLVDGSAFSTADLEGQWSVIDVWGLWCSDCMADAPYVAALASAIAQDPDLSFISIHTPPNASRADEAFGSYGSVEAYFDEKGYSNATVLDADASMRVWPHESPRFRTFKTILERRCQHAGSVS